MKARSPATKAKRKAQRLAKSRRDSGRWQATHYSRHPVKGPPELTRAKFPDKYPDKNV